MGSVAEQERAPLAEMFGDAMMDMVGREPVHFLNFDLEIFDRAILHVFELQRIRAIGPLVSHRADQPRLARAGQREHAEEISLIEIDVQLAVDGGAARLDIGDVEDLPVGAAGKAGAHGFAHH